MRTSGNEKDAIGKGIIDVAIELLDSDEDGREGAVLVSARIMCLKGFPNAFQASLLRQEIYHSGFGATYTSAADGLDNAFQMDDLSEGDMKVVPSLSH